jgi:hypothetical protein
MARRASHLFVDISAHGFGHLAQSAPVLNRLGELLPGLRITLRSGLPAEKLRERIRVPFVHLAAASDCGFAMHDALRIDHAATTAAYRAAHRDFPARIAAEAAQLAELQADAVFSNVSYLPLAGAACAGIPAAALCSLNWADLFEHYYGGEPWAPAIHAQMLAAYHSATFLRTTPGMPMPALERQVVIGPIATLGRQRRAELLEKVGAGGTAPEVRIVLVALGGIPTRLPIEDWPALPGTRCLVPASWQPVRPGFHAFEALGLPFADLLRSVDAVVTKPGYGTFAEAACNGTAIIYPRREDWPEQSCLIDWLRAHARCTEIAGQDLLAGNLAAALASCLSAAQPPLPVPDGDETAARCLMQLLS